MKFILCLLSLCTLFGIQIKADDSTMFYEENLNYCGDEIKEKGWGGTKTMTISMVAAYPQMPQYMGNHITRVRIGVVSSINNATLLIKEELDGEPVYTQELKTLSKGWNDVELSTPYPINTYKTLYVGYQASVEGGAYPVGLGNKDPTPNSFFMSTGGNFSDRSKNDSPLAIQVFIQGNSFTKLENLAQVTNIQTLYTLPNEPLQAWVNVQNNGINDIHQLTLQIKVGERESTHEITNANLGRGKANQYRVDMEGMPVGTYPIVCSVIQSNNQNFEDTLTYQAPSKVMVFNESWPKKVVCEEHTGTACGWCPQGIVLFEEMKKKYPDTFIPIAVHVYNDDDPMYIPEYIPNNGGIWNFVLAAPGFVLDRVKAKVCEGSYRVEQTFLDLHKKLNWTRINIKVGEISTTRKTVQVTSEVEFAQPQEGANYKLCFVLVENNVWEEGKNYYQKNSYTDNAAGVMGGWESKPSYVATTFQDVARSIQSFYGIENSVPKSLQAGKTYTYTTSLSLKKVLNTANAEVVVMILNGETGEVINANKIALQDEGQGIHEMESQRSSIHISGEEGGMSWQSEIPMIACSIYSLNGEELKTVFTTKSGSISLPRGHYIIRCQNLKEIVSKKIIVQ